MRAYRTWCAAVWLLVTLLSPRVVWADSPADPAAAREHFERGERLYAVGKFRAALDEFTAAYEAAPMPDFLFNIGQCHRRLGEHDEAIFFYDGFLERAAVSEEDRKTVEGLLAEERAARRRRAAVMATTAPAPRRRPLYEKWWLWTTVGAVVVVGATAATLAVSLNQPPRLPSGPLGTIDGR